MKKPEINLENKADAGLVQLPTPLYITGGQLKSAVREAYRLGFSRTLTKQAVRQTNKYICLPIMKAYRHTSCDGLTNYRLLFSFNAEGKSDGSDLVPAVQDISSDTWAAVSVNALPDSAEKDGV